MSYSIENLKLIFKVAALAERDFRADLESEELSNIGATYLSKAFDEVSSLKIATQKLIQEQTDMADILEQ